MINQVLVSTIAGAGTLFILSLKPDLVSYRQYFRLIYAEGTVTYDIIQLFALVLMTVFLLFFVVLVLPLVKLRQIFEKRRQIAKTYL